MQLDMHYYGTYAMARAAGMQPDACFIVATASQFVDDNAEDKDIEFRDGASIAVRATAHHATDLKNIDRKDQRRIWVPFHFIPGNEGGSFTERLICRKDSGIAREMVDHNLGQHRKSYALELLGITAHVYADTFSHYGFSGVSSRHNKVVNDSIELHGLTPEIERYVRDKERRFREKYGDEGGLIPNIKSWFAEELSGALGHGAVLTYPDRPYLRWSFEHEYPNVRREERDNPATFLEACEALHRTFRRFLGLRPEFRQDEGQEFSTIRGTVEDVLRRQAPKEDRIEAWKEAARDGGLFVGGEEIPDYDGDAWKASIDALDGTENSSAVVDLPAFRFQQAASMHRSYVLKELLPSYGLVVA